MRFPALATVIKEDSGATAVEYGLIVALFSVAAIGALTAVGTSLNTMYATATTALLTVAGG